jgi:hypothetical protein
VGGFGKFACLCCLVSWWSLGWSVNNDEKQNNNKMQNKKRKKRKKKEKK